MHGYQVRVIDIQNPSQSDSFNPFAYIRSNADIVRFVNNYIRATTPKNSNESDPFWTKAESKLETAIIQLMLVAYPDDCSMRKFLELLNLCKAKKQDSDPSDLDNLFERYKDSERVIWTDEVSGEDVVVSGKRAWENYHGVMDAAEDTVRSVIISALARYDTINNSPNLIEMLSGKDTIDFRALGNGYQGRLQKTALFIISSDIDRTYSSIVLWVLTSLYNELYLAAREHEDDRLPIPVQLYLDEFANTPACDNILQLFSTARSRGISINAIVQSLGQLKGMFKEEAEVIQGACDCLIYMGSSEPSVHKEISGQLGKYTLKKQSHSISNGLSGNSSTSTDVLGKELMSQDRVRLLPDDKCLVLIRGFDPIIDDKCFTQKLPQFQEAMRYGKFHFQQETDQQMMFGALGDEERQYVITHRLPTIWFSDEELNMIEDGYVDEDESDQYLEYAAHQIRQQIIQEQATCQEEQMTVGQMQLKDCLLDGRFTDDQISEAAAGLDAGLSEEQIMAYFRPEYSAERMHALRLLLQNR